MSKTYIVLEEMNYNSDPVVMEYVQSKYREAVSDFFEGRKKFYTPIYLERKLPPLEIIIDFEQESASLQVLRLETHEIRQEIENCFLKWIETEGQRILEQEDLVEIFKLNADKREIKKEMLVQDICYRLQYCELPDFHMKSMVQEFMNYDGMQMLIRVMVESVISPKYLKMLKSARKEEMGISVLTYHYRTHTTKRIIEKQKLGGQYIDFIVAAIDRKIKQFCKTKEKGFLIKEENLSPEKLQDQFRDFDWERMQLVTKKIQLFLPGKPQNGRPKKLTKYRFLIMNLEESLRKQFLPYADTPIDGILYVLYGYTAMLHNHKQIMEELSFSHLRKKHKMDLVVVFKDDVVLTDRVNLDEYKKEKKYFYYQRFQTFWVPGNKIRWPKFEEMLYIFSVYNLTQKKDEGKEKAKAEEKRSLEEQYGKLLKRLEKGKNSR